jgi:hypothetical protein
MPHELALEFASAGGQIRLAAPGRESLRRRGPDWARFPGNTVIADPRPVDAACLLTPRGDVGSPDAVLVTRLSGPVGELAALIGWPHATALGETVQEAVDQHCNDYRLIDQARPFAAPPDGVSVIVPARNSQDSIDPVLAAIRTAAAGLPWECVIVDDASLVPLTVREPDPHVRIVRAPQQQFCAGARNLGLEHARYNTVLFCDSDTVLPENFFAEHLPLHQVTPNLITVSMRDADDPRVRTTFTPDWQGLATVPEPVHVRTLDETDNWRTFGSGRRLGPVGLQYAVWGHNICISAELARKVRFRTDYVGWGLEDNMFAAHCIARGCFVRPVLATPVHHLPHPPRSGSAAQQERELLANLERYRRDLAAPAESPD